MNLKLKVFSFLCLLAFILAGCSSGGDEQGVGEYAGEASEYMEKVADFARDIPEKAEKAANDEQAKQELKDSLKEMKQEINEFGKVQAPEIAGDFHKEIVDNSKILKEKIDDYLERIDKGDINEDFVEKEDFSKASDKIKESFNKLKELGETEK
ncbi:hypothetical protein DRW41_13580 [Neobacillus piezotolerans]|uniref:Lipoprotein n=1 Tax=Neobacillus piezotolerans TaxID=2259171 RepID=A0A3D8GQJ3_9BACI|nr:DUF6376 family protein [Neobacillus piezotolerans]RDU36551.1 hypothetical protein DRW41_13580 [Neobacillus piezotolerans]